MSGTGYCRRPFIVFSRLRSQQGFTYDTVYYVDAKSENPRMGQRKEARI